ncbi:MAG: sensor histidine kinase [Deferrisomatales bacterium]
MRAEDLRAGVEAVAWACDGAFPFYRVALALPSHRAQKLHVAAAWARRPEEELAGFDFSVKGHPLEKILRSGGTLVRTDPLGDALGSPLERLYRGEGKAEELAVALDLGGRRGLVVFASREKGRFDPAACRWAEEVGAVLAVWARPWTGPEAPYALKEQYETLIEGALDGIAVLVDGDIAYANGSFREILGLPPGRKIRRRFADLLAPASCGPFAEAQDWLGRRGRVLPRLEVEAVSAAGAPLHLDIGLQRIQFRGETAVLVQVHNATQRAEREQDVRDSFARVDALLHTLAHDIRGPLTSILGFSQFLHERLPELPPAKVSDTLGVVCRASRSLKALVEGLLEYSSLGRSQAPMFDVAVQPLLRSVEQEVEGALRAAGARVEYGPLPAVVRGRPVELGRVFRNLLDNALKYGKPGEPPRVTVASTVQEGAFHVFCVRDNGVGIPPELAPQVFGLFQKGEGGGAGVGLAIVDRIVRGHGGRVWVESVPGDGCSFYFTLPMPSAGE